MQVQQTRWDTFRDFGFAWSAPLGGQKADEFCIAEVVMPLCDHDCTKVAKLRWHFAQCYNMAIADKELGATGEGKEPSTSTLQSAMTGAGLSFSA